MGEFFLLDDYFVNLTLLITLFYHIRFAGWIFIMGLDRLIPYVGGATFVVLALVTAVGGSGNIRNILASVFMVLWAARFIGFLLLGFWKTGWALRTRRGNLFDGIFTNIFPSLIRWISHMVWSWTGSLPITILNSPKIGSFHQPVFGSATDIVGTTLFIAGLLIESVADAQKYAFRNGPGRLDRSLFMRTGCWRYSRHPNYFGEIILHFGIWLITITPSVDGCVKGRPAAIQYATVVAPILSLLIVLFKLGLSLSEKGIAKRRYQNGIDWEGYSEYLKCTSILIPMPSGVWMALPTVVKRTIGLEFPFYVFDPTKEGYTGYTAGKAEKWAEKS
ncbi:unnamed protein product [Tuber aestivum]|uniref:Uncharacterized protein n=1 Tax=Tuber aestivum TaxID=59557 RepID=A0A292PN07_9PEZI|nr:unnamed protein product [Tuber aestivum]